MRNKESMSENWRPDIGEPARPNQNRRNHLIDMKGPAAGWRIFGPPRKACGVKDNPSVAINALFSGGAYAPRQSQRSRHGYRLVYGGGVAF